MPPPPPTAADPFALVGAVVERRFAVDAAVARGGFGVVYRARHLALRKTIALKVLFIPPGLGAPERALFLANFAQEAQTSATLEHPAIVRAFDFGVSRAPDGQDIPWMALEWIEGLSLAELIKERRGQPMPPAEALALLRPVFLALAYAHEEGVAHRDVKPSNIMRTSGRAGSVVNVATTRLLDFGIAKVMASDETIGAGDQLTRAPFSAFSLPYASPEQKSGMLTGPWTDVHAMGLILTELITGQPPYPGRDRLEVEIRITSPQRPTPAAFGLDVGAWEPVLARAVAQRYSDRFPDAGALLAALEATLPGVQVVPRNVPGTTEVMALPGVPAQTPLPTPSAPLASAAPTLSPSTITHSPTTSAVVPARPSSRGRVAAAVAGVLLAALAGAVAWQSLSAPADVPRAAAVNTSAASEHVPTPPPPAPPPTPVAAVAPPPVAPRAIVAPVAPPRAAPPARPAETPRPPRTRRQRVWRPDEM